MAEWYRSCSLLPLNLFIICLLENNVRALVITGDPSDDQLFDSWDSIYYEYVDLNANNEQSYVHILKKEIATLNFTITTIEHALYFFAIEPSTELADVISREGYDLTFPTDNPEINLNEVTSIINQLAPLKMRLLMRRQELQDYNAAHQQDSIDGQHFIKMLLRLSKHQGYSIKAKDITVAEYVGLLHYFLEDIKAQKEGLEHAD